jgi:chromosome segregation ATPase
MLLNLNDTIQVHLLVETALGDSKEFEILSQDEVDDLKKQVQTLTARIEQTQQNLAIQSKYRDAAISMTKLYSAGEKKKSFDGSGRIKNVFGHNRNSSEQSQAAQEERIATEKKCEDLAAELWFLEKRLIEPQNRLLKHTAGILQMTHKGPKVMNKEQPGAPAVNGIPGSPESMYTYSNARSSLEFVPSDENIFDERSLYRSFDRLDGVSEFDDLFGPPKGGNKQQMQMISQTEQKLEDLNRRLRDVITTANPERQSNYQHPPLASTTADGKPTEPGDTLMSHLDYLEKGITTISQEHGQIMRKGEESDGAMEETIEQMNNELHQLLLPYDEVRQLPPQITGMGLSDQMKYFQDSIDALQAQLSRGGNKGSGGNQEQMETVMMGLWDIIQSGEEEARQRKQERRQTRSQNNLPPDDDDSPDEIEDPNEQFSVQAFSGKVQWLYSQATRLKDQKKVLQRQIKQQRELNNKSDATKDAEMAQKVEELQRTQDLLRRTEMDSDAVREQLSLVMEKLDEARQQETLRNQARSNDDDAAIRQAQADLDKANQSIASLEEELQELKDDHSISAAELQSRINDKEGKITSLTAELAAAAAAQATFQTTADEKARALETKEKEMEEMNMELARRQTEVTIARAELDGAYGSRAQRAAEVAANPAIQKEIDDLSKKNSSLVAEIAALKATPQADPQMESKMETLKKELAETIEEYEQMTKASIEWEKERESLEGRIDKLTDEREKLETELSDEKVRWLGMKSPGVDSRQEAGSTSTTVLKNEFKTMMRNTRKEGADKLRVCFLALAFQLSS